MKNGFISFLLFLSSLSFAQVGINTSSPKATIDVVGSPLDVSKQDGIIPPRINGNDLRNKDNAYGANQTGALVYVTAVPSPLSAKTTSITAPGYYYFDGTVWVGLAINRAQPTDATRFLGGTVYSRFNSNTAGTPQVPDARVIGGAAGAGYSVGIDPFTSAKGGITAVIGNGYKVSNTSAGIIDIQFDTPFTEIYGISVNIYDSYRSVATGTYPTTQQYGNVINTLDNAQIAFISNTIIRVKTGNSTGGLSNRSIAFLVVGK